MVTPPADQVMALLDRSATHLGAGMLVCIDGVSAAGKSTFASDLAQALAQRGRDVRVLHTDAMLHGWDGLEHLDQTLDSLIRELAHGREGLWREWDWHQETWGQTRHEQAVNPTEVVILEGVGAASGPHRRHAAVQVWCGLATDQQAARWQARGDDLSQLPAWQLAEQALHAKWQTLNHADLRLDR